MKKKPKSKRKKKYRKKDMQMIKLFALVALDLLAMLSFMSGIWAVDIGTSAVLSGQHTEGLYGVRTGVEQYHLGLIICMLTFIGISFAFNYYVIKNVVELKRNG